MMNMKRNIIKIVVSTCFLAAFAAPSLALDCIAPVPSCTVVKTLEAKKIVVSNYCETKVALQIRCENCFSGVIKLNANSQSNFTMGPPIPKNPALPSYYTGLNCCPAYGDGFACPQARPERT